MLKRSVTLSGHRTSVSLEPEFWRVLDEIAAGRGISPNRLIAEIDAERTVANPDRGLASALRIYSLTYLLARR